MTGTTPSQGDGRSLSSYLSETRNNELSHKEALEAAYQEHERVREAAIRAIQLHAHQLEQERLQEEQRQILERQKREVERLKQEQRLRDEEKRLRELEAQSIPKLPPPQPAAPPAPAIPTPPSPSQPNGSSAIPERGIAAAAAVSKQDAPAKPNPFASPAGSSQPPTNGVKTSIESAPPVAPSAVSPFASAATPPTIPSTNPLAKQANPFEKPSSPAINPFTQATPQVNGIIAPAANANGPTTHAATTHSTQSRVVQDRYTQIHQNLKKLRAAMVAQMNANPQLKKRAGEMRREIRKSVGQLTSEKGANKKQLERIRSILTEALTGQPPNAPVDPSDYIREAREPVQGALHNGQLPSLFIYLLNQLAKAFINQFINECGASPENADPVGVIAAQIFSAKEFLWRGGSLVDIMMAKFRVACPVVFGYRGSEKTEQGRTNLGWKKEGNGQWIPEQQHIDRMKGLGAGYASVALRDFSRSSNVNPWPPSRYWKSFAEVVNTPDAEISNTQCVVLRAMIFLYEERFIGFYGNQAIAALRKALVEFPQRATNKPPGVHALQILGQLYWKDLGLDLR
ncbi:GLE1-like protein-domain-containing protein [Xylariales sp. PMI_506]|nr:GLE1-like protein-domain-containing protein [Xylariales sp. PMI_506]